jgi:hypothetical protein
MHSFTVVMPFANEHGEDVNEDHGSNGEYGGLLLECCESAMAFVRANENGDEKTARKCYDELRNLCEQIDAHEHEEGKDGGDDGE